MLSSPLTTIGGILAAIGAAATVVDDPTWKMILAAIGAIGIALLGIAARDNNKSSEEVGVKSPQD